MLLPESRARDRTAHYSAPQWIISKSAAKYTPHLSPPYQFFRYRYLKSF